MIDNLVNHGVEKLTPELFSELVDDSFPMDDMEKLNRDPIKIFNTYLDKNGKGFVTVDDIKKLSSNDIKMTALYSESTHGPVKVDYQTKKKKSPPEQSEDGDHDEL